MTDILAAVADSYSHFKPTKPIHFIALQLARRLNDVKAFRHYLILFEHYPEELLVSLYRECAQDGTKTGEAFMARLRAVSEAPL
jgi:hypothetical protein